MFASPRATGDRRMTRLARDRLGEKPLYWTHHGDERFAFASELRALRVLPGVESQIDPVSRDRTAATGRSSRTRTRSTQGVRQLPPGGLLEV